MTGAPRAHGLSPLRLAAKLGKKKMLEHVLSARKILMWKWGPVSSYMCPLDEIDTAFCRREGEERDAYVDPQARNSLPLTLALP